MCVSRFDLLAKFIKDLIISFDHRTVLELLQTLKSLLIPFWVNTLREYFKICSVQATFNLGSLLWLLEKKISVCNETNYRQGPTDTLYNLFGGCRHKVITQSGLGLVAQTSVRLVRWGEITRHNGLPASARTAINLYGKYFSFAGRRYPSLKMILIPMKTYLLMSGRSCSFRSFVDCGIRFSQSWCSQIVSLFRARRQCVFIHQCPVV